MRRDVVNKFNRGEVAPSALLRDDVEKINNSAELMTNFLPERLGTMSYRSGTRNEAASIGDYMVPFVRSTTETAILGFTTTTLKIWDNINGALVDQPAGVMTLNNQTFDTNISNWTNISGAGSTAAWQTGGYASLTGTGATSAKLWQTFGGSGFAGVEHCIQITIARAPCVVKIGENGRDSTDIFEGTLEPGVHSLVFTPVASLPTITLTNSSSYATWVDAVEITAGGTLAFTLPTTITDVTTIRYAQSADVIYVATGNTPQFKVERRGVKSWSLVDYRVDDGPFGLINNTDITLTPGALEGDTTLTSNEPYFMASDVGTLFRLTSAGQESSASVSAEDDGTNSVRVTGVDTIRNVTISRSGTWSAIVTLQRSTDDVTWSDVETYTSNGSKTYNDGLDNSILYYRLWVKTGDYTSGTVVLNISYAAGSQDGVCRVTDYTDSQNVDVQVLQDFGKTDPTRDWYKGEWGGDAGWPTAVSLYESRLWWAGETKLWGSVSDAFASFDTDLEGSDRAIRRTIGFGPVDRVEWLAPSSRLLMGLASDVINVRSSSFGEILTSTNVNLKAGSSQGVADIEPVRINDGVVYAHRSGIKVLSLLYDLNRDTHLTEDLTILHPDLCKVDVSGGIVRMAYSTQPEPRVYVVLSNGEMRVYLIDLLEDVSAWSRITLAEGTIQDVVVLPGLVEDEVWVRVTRNGADYLERFSQMADMVSEHYDGAKVYTSPGTTITGLSHLEGDTVSVWADGQDRGTYTVSSGQITVSASWTTVTVGLAYTADYKSNKLGAKTGAPSAIGRQKQVVDLHFAMSDYWPASLQHGPDFDTLEDMPLLEDGTTLPATTLVTEYDEYPIEFNGEEEIDPRICIRATGPIKIHALSYGLIVSGDSAGQGG